MAPLDRLQSASALRLTLIATVVMTIAFTVLSRVLGFEFFDTLTGTADWLALKAVVTPLKFALFLGGVLIAVAAAMRLLPRWLRAG